ncbi:MAG: hypothetical protein ACYTDY_00540, partial [Planctomycetota bacterium]
MHRRTALPTLLLLAALAVAPGRVLSEGGGPEEDLGPAPASVYVNYDDEEMNRLLDSAGKAAAVGDYEKATDRYQKAA